MPSTPTVLECQAASALPPAVFCWTKMGTEAGQSLDLILARKELERRAGGGLFGWGIGNSLGVAPDLARQAVAGDVEVLFTPMKSAPKSLDVSPGQVLLWLEYVSSSGRVKRLPTNVLITSRGGAGKRAHYALLCSSDEPLARSQSAPCFAVEEVRNFTTLNRVGASQVTSVVRYSRNQRSIERPYSVAFTAKLGGDGFVKLASPVVLEGHLAELYASACRSSCPQEWLETVGQLKMAAMQAMQRSHSDNDLFAGLRLLAV